MRGASLPFKIQEKNPCIKNFGGGGFRAPKMLYALILCVFYLLLIVVGGRLHCAHPKIAGKLSRFRVFRTRRPGKKWVSGLWPEIEKIAPELSAAFCAAYGFTGAFGRNLCKFTFPHGRRNLRKSLLFAARPTGVEGAKKWLRYKLR